MTKTFPPLDIEEIAGSIIFLRGQRVMLSPDLARLYGVPSKVLMQAVKRNLERFPSDFMYRTTWQEVMNLRSQIVTSSWGGLRYLPYAFTEQGVAMLSSVLKSRRAIEVNRIMSFNFNLEFSAFLSFPHALSGNPGKNVDPRQKHSGMTTSWAASKSEKHDEEISVIFDAIRRLMQVPEKPKRMIGFHP
jgi:hypothetical protein